MAADWFGKKTDKDYGKDKPTATEGVHDAMGKVIGINSGIVGAAGAAKAAADFASGAFDKGPAPMTRAGVIGAAARAGYDWYKETFGR